MTVFWIWFTCQKKKAVTSEGSHALPKRGGSELLKDRPMGTQDWGAMGGGSVHRGLGPGCTVLCTLRLGGQSSLENALRLGQALTRGPEGKEVEPASGYKDLVTFSWLKASIRFIAVSRAVTMFRKSWSCSHRGLERRSREIFTADFDMAVSSKVQ